MAARKAGLPAQRLQLSVGFPPTIGLGSGGDFVVKTVPEKEFLVRLPEKSDDPVNRFEFKRVKLFHPLQYTLAAYRRKMNAPGFCLCFEANFSYFYGSEE